MQDLQKVPVSAEPQTSVQPGQEWTHARVGIYCFSDVFDIIDKVITGFVRSPFQFSKECEIDFVGLVFP